MAAAHFLTTWFWHLNRARAILITPLLLCALPSLVPAQGETAPDGEPKETPVSAEPETAPEQSTPAPIPGNQLANARSPYLRGHADNPVHWREWTPEALAEARDQNKPIYLSIGYAACHYCHVMEAESFMDESVAALINENFIPIKVDREERPDLDNIYMQIFQAMSGSNGGWPLNVWMAPDLTPFYGSTYLPTEPIEGLPAFRDVLRQVSALWKEDPGTIQKQNHQMAEVLKQLHTMDDKAHNLDLRTLTTAANELAATYDITSGGLGLAPKFPQPLQLNLLLTQWHRSGDPFYKEMVVETARHMAGGGIYDQIGGGFHRYTTDDRWLVPHFEKMLTTNAELGRLYTRLWQVTRNPADERIARETLDALLRDFSTETGGFVTSLNAQSGGQEGGFYTWLPEEIQLAFANQENGDALSQAFADAFALSPIAVKTGEAELQRSVITRKGNSTKPLSAEAQAAREVLQSVRENRPKPARDEKIVTSLNGLTIAALAEAGAVFQEPRYTQAAERAAEYLLTTGRSEDRLVHDTIDGKPGERVFLDDYAATTLACTTLFETTGDVRWIKFANLLAVEMIQLFWDDTQHVFYFTLDEQAELPIRPLDLQDSTSPSGNSLATLAVARLGFLLNNPSYREISKKSVQSVMALFARNYELIPGILEALHFLEAGPPEFAVAGFRDDPATTEILQNVYQTFAPGKIVAIRYFDQPAEESALPEETNPVDEPAPAEVEELTQNKEVPDTKESPHDEEEIVALLQAKTPIDGAATLYICENYTCRAPLTDLEEIRKQLAEFAKPDTAANKTNPE